MTEKEFTRIIKLYSGIVFRTALCFVKNKADADDIVQEVFLRFYTYNGSFESDEHIKMWLIKVTVNNSKNFLKYQKLRQFLPLEKAENKEIPKENEDLLLPIIMKMKTKSRLVLYMFYYEGYSVKEIAEILKENESAVTSQLYRGRKQLKKLLLKEGYNELQ
ncbi:MAG: sigma-70 family RNA polymerase sigma factor [Ruminiclostridium sp.]|nr:sigma-70 family RNA polymerase sigma factor [Ruminiclostridium sp.]